MHLERELATKLGLFQTVFKDVPIGCTDFLINNAQEASKHHRNVICLHKGTFLLSCFPNNFKAGPILILSSSHKLNYFICVWKMYSEVKTAVKANLPVLEKGKG